MITDKKLVGNGQSLQTFLPQPCWEEKSWWNDETALKTFYTNRVRRKVGG